MWLFRKRFSFIGISNVLTVDIIMDVNHSLPKASQNKPVQMTIPQIYRMQMSGPQALKKQAPISPLFLSLRLPRPQVPIPQGPRPQPRPQDLEIGNATIHNINSTKKVINTHIFNILNCLKLIIYVIFKVGPVAKEDKDLNALVGNNLN